MIFRGLGIRGFRSFGGLDIQYLGPLSQVTAIAGENNVGKSNALSVYAYLSQHLKRGSFDRAQVLTDPEDVPRDWPGTELLRFSVGVELSDEDLATWQVSAGEPYEALGATLQTAAFRRTDDLVTWFDFEVTANGDIRPVWEQVQESIVQVDSVLQSRVRDDISSLSSILANIAGGNDRDDWDRVSSAWNVRAAVPSTVYLPAFRRITGVQPAAAAPEGSAITGPDFSQLIEHFHAYQAPSNPLDREAKKAKFAELQAFVKIVLDDPDASFEVAGDKSRVFVTTTNGERQLDKLGTGIEEVLLIAAAATFSPTSLVCIEEPELHLHPTLQRQLMEYLAKQETTRTLVTTHSPTVLNSPGVSVLHATMANGHTSIDRAINGSDRARVAFSLGARPSDLVQSNFVVWVEGPSDRLYLRRWLSQVNEDLLEGSHYSIVFYGGRLLSHLSFDDEEVQDFIHMQSISRRFAVVIDSDRTAEGETLNDTKTRILEEIDGNGGTAWVTAGREIENYVSAERIREAMNLAYEGKEFAIGEGLWDQRLPTYFDGLKVRPSKVTVAKHVAELWTARDWQLDGLERTAELAARISEANR